MRICVNIKYQRSDSLLEIIYNKLLSTYSDSKEMTNRIVLLQKNWCALRDEHCNIAYEKYEDGGGNFKWIIYLNCLLELTENRIKELQLLLNN